MFLILLFTLVLMSDYLESDMLSHAAIALHMEKKVQKDHRIWGRHKTTQMVVEDEKVSPR